MLMSGRMSVGVVTIEAKPKIAISSATMTNVYGLCREKRTIHIKRSLLACCPEAAISACPIQNGQSAPVGSLHVVRASRERLSDKYWFLVVRCPTLLSNAVALPNVLRSEETVRSFCFKRFACVDHPSHRQ